MLDQRSQLVLASHMVGSGCNGAYRLKSPTLKSVYENAVRTHSLGTYLGYSSAPLNVDVARAVNLYLQDSVRALQCYRFHFGSAQLVSGVVSPWEAEHLRMRQSTIDLEI